MENRTNFFYCKKSTFWLIAIMLISTFFVKIDGFSSNYPADLPKRSDFQSHGPAHIQRDLQYSGAIALNVEYRGELSKSSSVAVVLKIIYHDGIREALFEMTPVEGGWTTRVTNGCLVGMMGGCQTQGTDEMKDLLFWASRVPMTLNALHVELAFVDDQGKWDNNNGSNYIFVFGELN